MKLKTFQQNTITKLTANFYKLWQGAHSSAMFVFKSPTGSGKTIMMAEFLKQIAGDMQFDVDKAFVWISKGELATQSKQKLNSYYDHGAHLKDLNDLGTGFLGKNEIFFVNWEKVVSGAKDNRILRTKGEANTTFDEFIINTHEQGRELVLIVDEAHLNLTTTLAQEIIAIINPRIEIHVSATPKHTPNGEDIGDGKAAFVKVNHADVVQEGLIKESIKIMPKDEIEALEQSGTHDLDELMLDLAMTKHGELTDAYQQQGVSINPLILIQLPNDEKDQPEADSGQNKLDFTKAYLTLCGVDTQTELAIWLSNKKENLEQIIKNDSPIKFLIFKQAIATGWDCPRAQILVSYREMVNPTFQTQVLGRILRMPEAKHYPDSILNHAYCYTSYERAEVSTGVGQSGESTELNIHHTSIKTSTDNITLDSVYIGRADYNDLGASFQTLFIDLANKSVGIDSAEDNSTALKKLASYGLDISATTVTRNLIVDADIEVYDDFINEIKKADGELDHAASANDVRRLFDLSLHATLKKQQEDASKYGNLVRSAGILKSTLRVWLKAIITDESDLYAIVSNDLDDPNASKLKPIIEKALTAYKPIRQAEVKVNTEKSIQTLPFSLQERLSYSEDYSDVDMAKYAYADRQESEAKSISQQ